MKNAMAIVAVLSALVATPASAAPTRSSPIAVAPDGHVFVVNPDSNTVARLEFPAPPGLGTLTEERAVGAYPRTLALDATHVFTAGQNDDSVWRLDQAGLANPVGPIDLGHGCGPYGVAVTPAGDRVLVTCQGTSEVVILNAGLVVTARIDLAWPNARAIAISSDGTKAYVSHYLTEEPDNNVHVSVIDVPNNAVSTVFSVAPDTTTCETQNSGQGPLNLISAIVLMPDGAPADVANQVWLGGTQENNLSKGLFKRDSAFKNMPGSALFPWVRYAAFPTGGINRNIYKASFHDVTRFGIYKLDATSGNLIGKLDIDEANNATDIEFSADGTTAYVVDLMFDSYHIFNTRKGQGSDVTTLFAAPSSFGPGGADPTEPCVPDALRPITAEGPFRMGPQAQISVIDDYDPVDTTNTIVLTGVDFDAVHYMSTGQNKMRRVPDGIGTAPMGVRLAADGNSVFVANYLSRNIVRVASAQPVDGTGTPANFRCIKGDFNKTCNTNNDCPAATGFCNHPGGAACTQESDCGGNGPCIRGADCVPLVLGQPVWSITGVLTVDPAVDPLPGGAAILDGKILFNTAARDSSVPNGVGLGTAAPRFNDPVVTARVPGSLTSTSHDASYVTCSTCHADFGGQDGRTWDFAQFGASLRNTMDLRGRPGFAPGTCSNNPSRECFFDSACDNGDATLDFCKANPAMIPPNIPPADRDRWFNPMLTVHWNGDRDEVEDFEHTYRQLMGAGDCDSAEDVSTCMGALTQRSRSTSSELPRENINKDLPCPFGCRPAADGMANCPDGCRDVEPDLGPPNRNLPGEGGHNVGVRLTHMADFVYSLTAFPRNPNLPNEATERGRRVFNDPQVACTSCHLGGPGAGKQFFTDKKPNASFDPANPGRSDRNNPFVRHDVGTINLFDAQDPGATAAKNQLFQNPRVPIPGNRGPLGDYITPVLNDLWNTAPYLHDGSAHTLLDVVRPCDTTLDDCYAAGRGRNLNGQHGVTAILTPQQLNDLVAFQNALTLDAIVGTNERVISAGALDLSAASVRFPKAGARRRSSGSRVTLRGVLRGAPRAIDPATDGVVFTLGTPAGQEVAVFTRTFSMRGKGRRLVGRSNTGGSLSVVLTKTGTGYRFAAKGKKLDLTALDVDRLDPKNRDLTVAFEISGTTFVKNRNLTRRKAAYALPRKRAARLATASN